MNLNDEPFEEGAFKVKKGESFSRTFSYNKTTDTTPALANIIQTEMMDADIGT